MSFLAVTLVSLIASQAVGQKWSNGGQGAWGGFQKGSWGGQGAFGGNRWAQQGNWMGNGWGWGGRGAGRAGGHAGGRVGGHGGGLVAGHGGGRVGGGHVGGGFGGGGHGGGVGHGGGGFGGGHGGGGFGGGHGGGYGQASYLWNNGTITCTAVDAVGAVTVSFALTIRRNIQNMWGWGGHKKQGNPLTASLQINPLAGFLGAGAYDIVFTQMGRTTPACTPDGMGPVIRPVSKQYGKWGNVWGGGWGTNGVVSTVTLVAGTAQTVSLDGLLPLKSLAQFAGRGLLMCADGALTTDATGQTICPAASILACCTLGFDNQGAALP